MRALWGARKQNARLEVPGKDVSILRTPEDLPEIPDGIDLAETVAASDNILLLGKLKEMGIGEETLAKLKSLDGMATSTGKFLSISLEKTHRMYFFQLVALMEIAEKLRTTELADANIKGEQRAFFLKCYTDMVKEAGRGYNNMMQGAQGLVSMLLASSDKPGAPAGNSKPGWTRRMLKKRK